MASVSVDAAERSLEKHRRSLSLLFYRAVRDLKPVWMLEEMRTTETFYREEDLSQRRYTPAEALLYAIVHDHRAYARYLLGRYADEALAKPGERFCCCPSSAPHVSTAVRYDRRYILLLLLQGARRSRTPPDPDPDPDPGRTPLHLACELRRPEAVVLLLGSGASPHAEDHDGLTPLDLLLQKLLRDSDSDSDPDSEARRCLDSLLMFAPAAAARFKLKARLLAEPRPWRDALGEETFGYLSGRRPAPLHLAAMQTILGRLSPAAFPESLHDLPIPSALKPPGLPQNPRVPA